MGIASRHALRLARRRDHSMRDRLALPVIGVVSALVVLSVGVSLVGRQTEVPRGYDVSALPALNAFLNGTSAVLLTVGYVFIRLKKVTAAGLGGVRRAEDSARAAAGAHAHG